MINKNRRNFIKLLIIGGGAVVLGKFFGSAVVELLNGQSKYSKSSKVAKRNNLPVFSKNGEEVFIVDNEQ